MMIDLNNYLTQCAPYVASSTMRAIVITESKGNPLAIKLNNGKSLSYSAKNLAQASAWVNYLEANGYNFDVGLGQINIRNIHKYGYLARDMLNPCTNLQLASYILYQNYQSALKNSVTSSQALFKAISAYNTGNYVDGLKNGYVQKVVRNSINH